MNFKVISLALAAIVFIGFCLYIFFDLYIIIYNPRQSDNEEYCEQNKNECEFEHFFGFIPQYLTRATLTTVCDLIFICILMCCYCWYIVGESAMRKTLLDNDSDKHKMQQ